MKKKLNILLLIAFILGLLYLIYSGWYWGTSMSAGSSTDQAGAALASVLVTPHLICAGIAVIFNALGLFMRKAGFALTGAILYTVAIVLFPPYFMFIVLEAVLSYIGFAQIKKAQ